ncbi:ribosome biogenesis protein UTP23-like [Vairimorpha necatrix]|uniref:Ribosome biogenesis protein UTP23-like n=1 Tax=Vairimorpha necatrix TaxID=6039 RepID=A0AAX4JDL1_9MICR
MIKKIQKSNKKSLKLLNKVDFRLPYQVLIDDTFINNMNKYGKRYKHLKETFKSEPKLFFTKCILNKYKSLNKEYENDISDNCEMVKCPHTDKSDVLKCLSFVFRRFNKNHYIVGTSNKEIMDKYRDRSDVPLLNFNKGQIKLFINTEKIPEKSIYSTEATKKELERLEKIFGNDKQEVSEESEKFEDVNIEELEVSNDKEPEE